jgi:hypothetical protein
MLNNSSLIVTQKQLTRILVIQKINSFTTTQESKPKTKKTKTLG